MNNVWLYVIGALVIGGVAWAGLQSRGGAESNNANNNTQTEESQGSLRSLLSMGTAQQCTFESEESSGVAFVAQQRMRGDFEVVVGDGRESGHVIVKDDTAFVWVDGETQGFKMSTEGQADDSAVNDQFDLDEDVNYECQPWQVDQSKFQEPRNVTFTDFSELLQGLQGGAGASANFGL